MRLACLAIPVVAAFVVGCASTETVKEARGQGVARTYAYGYQPVYDATLAAAKTKSLEVVEIPPRTGLLLNVLSNASGSWLIIDSQNTDIVEGALSRPQ